MGGSDGTMPRLLASCDVSAMREGPEVRSVIAAERQMALYGLPGKPDSREGYDLEVLPKTLEYAEELRAAVAEPEGSTAEGMRNQAEWSRIMLAELRKQEMTRARNAPQVNGQVLPRPEEQPLYDTMAMPDLAAVEASLERSRLLLDFGIDAVAMALDASASIEATNSLEKMLAHQLAVTHKMAIEQMHRAHGACSPEIEIKRLNAASRLMTAFQEGLLTVKKLRQGQQKITVQHVNVSHGSQAVIGNIAREGQ
jgi:hypothetical protein